MNPLLRAPWAKGGVALFGVQELVMDKLPQTDSEPHRAARTRHAGHGGRGQRHRRAPEFAEPTPPGSPVARPPAPRTNDVIACVAVAVAVATAIGASFLGTKFRAVLADKVGND